MELLRQALGLHIRGCKLNSAPLLEMLLTFYRKTLSDHKPRDQVIRFLEPDSIKVTVFNDDRVDRRDFERKHLLHCGMDFTAGYLIGSHASFKKGWKTEDTSDILNKAESVKRRMKHTIFNTDEELCFKPPNFNEEKKMFSCDVTRVDDGDSLSEPIMPRNTFNRTLIL